MKKLGKTVFSIIVIAMLAITVITIAFADEKCAHPSLGQQYIDAGRFYHLCNICGSKVYTEDTLERFENTNYEVSPAAHEHVWGIETYYETAHPHNSYMACLSCTAKQYTGSSTTLPHGNGANGTCKECGSHSYAPTGDAGIHPHEVQERCSCGDIRLKMFSVLGTCNACTASARTVTNSSDPVNCVFSYIDGDDNISIPITVPATFVVTFTNTYNHPNPEITQDPEQMSFASFYCKVSASVENVPIHAPDVIASATYHDIPYYSSTGALIGSQSVRISNNEAIGETGTAIIDNQLVTFAFLLDQNPSYTTVSGICHLADSAQHTTANVTVYYD